MVNYKGAVAALLYMASSTFLVIVNKFLLSVYDAKVTNLLSLCQCLTVVAVIYFGRKLGWVDVRPFNKRTFYRLLPLNVAFIVYMVLGMVAIRVVSVPMYTTLRRTTVLVVMVMEYFVLGKKPTYAIVGCVSVMIFGALVAGYQDFHKSLSSYVIVMLYNMATAIYLICINLCAGSGLPKSHEKDDAIEMSSSKDSDVKRMFLNALDEEVPLMYRNRLPLPQMEAGFDPSVPHSEWPALANPPSHPPSPSALVAPPANPPRPPLATAPQSRREKVPPLELAMYNALIAFPLFAIISYSRGELSELMNSEVVGLAGFQLSFALSCIIAVVLNFAIFLNTSLNSSLTQSVCGQAKDVAVVLLGFFLFADSHHDSVKIMGIFIGFAGSMLYGYVKYQNRNKK